MILIIIFASSIFNRMVIILIYCWKKNNSINFCCYNFFHRKNHNKMQSLLTAVKKHVSKSNQWKNEGFLIAWPAF